jgi:hypothetical protein
MTNEMKLLRSFIEASGFEVEEVFDKVSCKCKPNALALGGDRDCIECFGIGYDLVTDDYKVTKKLSIPAGGRGSSKIPLDFVLPCVPLPIDSKAWGCIVAFIGSHREDIINDINGYGGLGFMLDFMERNSDEY